MSRHDLAPISPPAWRVAVFGLALVTSTVILAALIMAGQGQAHQATLTIERFTDQWEIRSGRAEADRLRLQPAANSIGTALHLIDSTSFTLQARVDLEGAGSGGLIVQAADPDHFTAFLISNDGYFRVGDYRNGAWIDRAAWRAWPHIERAGSTNVLRAECGSDRCVFFVNDEWTWQEEGVPGTHRIGVVADGAEARFDQLSWQP
jgi:hypothetical protein